uniref:Uncharacterized protein n=1 Tax=Oxyrrhis marina TaxID=2969 RepID=A0A7S3XG71_OXYMA
MCRRAGAVGVVFLGLQAMPRGSLNVADATTDGLATRSVVFAAIDGASKVGKELQEVIFQSVLPVHFALWVAALFAWCFRGVQMLWAAAALTLEMPAKDAMAADAMGSETFTLLMTPNADAEEVREGKP